LNCLAGPAGNIHEFGLALVHHYGMANVILRPDWFIPEKFATPERGFRDRRRFLKELGLGGAGLLAARGFGAAPAAGAQARYPAPRNKEFDPGWRLTNERVAATYNNFYEFTTTKDKVHQMVDQFVIEPWPVEIAGLVGKPMTVDAQELIGMFGLEERVYRFRCVEAWAMIVPWTGFELRKLLDKVQPKPAAKFIRFVTALRPAQMPGVLRVPHYPWPYTEGLRLDEARHPLTMVVTGIYGKPLPKQHGAPIRIVVPWKYGYKSIKSVVKIEFTDQQPATLWETLQPREYPFESNVNPDVPHPRWSQATERIIDTGERVKTKYLNGYADAVGHLYLARMAATPARKPRPPGKRPVEAPRAPSVPSSVVFVCSANLCRSVMAHAICADEVTRRRLPLRVTSAGIWDFSGTPPVDEVWLTCVQHCTPVQKLAATHVRDVDLRAATRIFAMEHKHVAVLTRDHGVPRSRITLLGAMDPHGGDVEIADPIGQDLRAFDRCYVRLRRCIRQYLATTDELQPGTKARNRPKRPRPKGRPGKPPPPAARATGRP
jgi:sulfoxide reductase catalytic subunit YedY